jgi:YVTN family beta-propeller protein
MKTITTILSFILISSNIFAQKTDSLIYLQISNEAIGTIKLEGFPDFLAVDGDDVWITNIGKVQKLSAKSKTLTLSVDISEPCGAPIVAEGSLWVANCKDKSIYRINHRTGKIIDIIPINISDPYGEISLAFGAGSLWILTDSEGTLSRINPKTNKIEANIKVNRHSYCATYGFNSVWITTSENQGFVQRIDPKTNKVVSTIPVGSYPRFIAAGENGVWTLNQKDGTVSHINPDLNKVIATIKAEVPGPGGDIAVGNNKVWVRSMKGTFLLTIDPLNNKVLNRYLPLCGSGAVRVSNKYIWVSAHDVNSIWILEKK